MAARVIAARAPIERHMTHEFRCMVSSLAMLQACSMASDEGMPEFWLFIHGACVAAIVDWRSISHL